MGGIRYPRNWENILQQPVFAENLRIISLGKIRSALINEMMNMYYHVFADVVDKRICLALSGGIDSSILAAFMRLNNMPFTAITLGSGPEHPDIIHAKLLARQFAFEHRVFLPSAAKSGKDVYNDLFLAISSIGFKYAICADAVDEMLGGYWEHINYAKFCKDESKNDTEKMKWTFERFWSRLAVNHLDPMNHYAEKYGIEVILPYLAINDLLRSTIPSQRVCGEHGKVVLRGLGDQLGLPDEIINRPKLGLCDIWKEF